MLMFIIPFVLIATAPLNSTLLWIGFIVWLVGNSLAMVSDSQLAAWRRDPANKGKPVARACGNIRVIQIIFLSGCIAPYAIITLCPLWLDRLTRQQFSYSFCLKSPAFPTPKSKPYALVGMITEPIRQR